ncbi:hypothetical protein [Latilactobacillus sakei]|uniref:Uncharacterized protein n=1 Tax=Latilactobacillus sakei TaxID=1599 RepID=A0AAF0K3V5_LATSK|nr:hypothetical protein [Latilactobacillus sakei]WGI18889.1 hypothetical protein QBD03_09070 [Latilactobacillus sakei]
MKLKKTQGFQTMGKRTLFTSMAAVALLGSTTTAVMATTAQHVDAVSNQVSPKILMPGDTVTANARVHVLKDGVLTWLTIPNVTKTVGNTWVDWTIPAPVIDGYTPDEDTMVISYISDKNVFNTESNIIYTKNGGTNGIPASTPDKKLGDYTFNIDSSSNPGFNQRLEYTGANEWTPNDSQFDVTVRGSNFSDWSIEAYRPDDPSQKTDAYLDMMTSGILTSPQLGTHRVPITRYYGFYEKVLNVEGYINVTVTLDGKTTGDLNHIGENNNSSNESSNSSSSSNSESSSESSSQESSNSSSSSNSESSSESSSQESSHSNSSSNSESSSESSSQESSNSNSSSSSESSSDSSNQESSHSNSSSNSESSSESSSQESSNSNSSSSSESGSDSSNQESSHSNSSSNSESSSESSSQESSNSNSSSNSGSSSDTTSHTTGSSSMSSSDQSTSTHKTPGTTTSNGAGSTSHSANGTVNVTDHQGTTTNSADKTKPVTAEKGNKPTTLLQTGQDNHGMTIATIFAGIVASLAGLFVFGKRF